MKKIFAAVLGLGGLALVLMGAGSIVNTPGIPAGAIMSFGMATCPQGWVAADGVAKATATYPALDAAFATTWGARSGGNFQIPDLNSAGRYLRGGTAGTLQAQATAKNGLTVTNNAVTSGFQNASHYHSTPAITAPSGAAVSTTVRANAEGATAQIASGTETSNHGHSVTSNVVLNGGDAETRPITAVVNYCIKF